MTSDFRISKANLIALATYAVLMVFVSLLGAIGPARRILRIQPTEALKAE